MFNHTFIGDYHIVFVGACRVCCVFDLFRPHFLPPWNTFSSHLRRLFQTPGIYGHSQNPSGVSSLDLGYPKPIAKPSRMCETNGSTANIVDLKLETSDVQH